MGENKSVQRPDLIAVLLVDFDVSLLGKLRVGSEDQIHTQVSEIEVNDVTERSTLCFILQGV